ncbi:MAG: endonuclease/exonuclease/phosphatase family protein [Rhodobacteraceae bacterium]|nr:endonuclease/exonuclease/phosphatase family protein [Paracoccaceae bacterium]
MRAWLAACLFFAALGAPSIADTLRIASFNTELAQDGPGLLLKHLNRGTDPATEAVLQVIAAAQPDILVLQSLDWDARNQTLQSLADRLGEAGNHYSHLFALKPNSGQEMPLDLDGDGRTGGPGDAQGFGYFTGQGGMAILSRYPILTGEVRDYSQILWSDLPDALLPNHPDGSPFPSAEALAVQRLSSVGHWAVPIQLDSGTVLTVLAFQAGPPVFDGPEDRNGRRNHDEIQLWARVLDGQFGPPPPAPFVIAGGANLDPADSDGRTEAIRTLLSDPRLQDPHPSSPGAAVAPDQGHSSPNAQDTVDWRGIGRFRVDYVLPSSDLTVTASEVYWPPDKDPMAEIAQTASRHRLVWVDLAVH